MVEIRLGTGLGGPTNEGSGAGGDGVLRLNRQYTGFFESDGKRTESDRKATGFFESNRRATRSFESGRRATGFFESDGNATGFSDSDRK